MHLKVACESHLKNGPHTFSIRLSSSCVLTEISISIVHMTTGTGDGGGAGGRSKPVLGRESTDSISGEVSCMMGDEIRRLLAGSGLHRNRALPYLDISTAQELPV